MMCTVVDSANGLAVALPDEVIHRLGLREGSQVEVVFDGDSGCGSVWRIWTRSRSTSTPSSPSKVDAFIAHYRPALLALAR